MDKPKLEITVKIQQYQETQTSSYKGLTGGWSKWGGARAAVVKERVGTYWICQSCGDQQPQALSPYLVSLPSLLPGEHFRVCAICYNGNCTKLIHRLQTTD